MSGRCSHGATFRRQPEAELGWPVIFGLLCGVAAFFLGYRDTFSIVCLILCGFVFWTIVMEFYRGAKVISARTGMSTLLSAHELAMRHRAATGSYVVHFGMVPVYKP